MRVFARKPRGSSEVCDSAPDFDLLAFEPFPTKPVSRPRHALKFFENRHPVPHYTP